MPNPKELRILFLGTPEFAATTLQKLVEEKANIVAVVTAPDKPAGRGLSIQKSAVKLVAEQHGLKTLQPVRLKDPDFLADLQSLNIDLGIVVAFRMLPEVVWQMPRMGTFNLHGSLLPKYRGAAPIHWAIINGETETGLTTFFLKHAIDTGDLLMQEKIPILPEDNLGTMYEKMMHQGANLVWKTVMGIAEGNLKSFPQKEEDLMLAPKITKETGLIQFHWPVSRVSNLVRGLSPSPGAYTIFQSKLVKILKGRPASFPLNSVEPGTWRVLEPGRLGIACSDAWFEVEELQPEGKRKMNAKEFLAGHPIEKR